MRHTKNLNIPKLEVDAIYNTSEVAEILRISKKTLLRIIKSKLLKVNTDFRPFAIYGQHIIDFINNSFDYKEAKSLK